MMTDKCQNDRETLITTRYTSRLVDQDWFNENDDESKSEKYAKIRN